MKEYVIPVVTTLLAIGGLFAIRKKPRFLGDLATDDDEAVVTVDQLVLPLGVAPPVGAGAVGIRVVGKDAESLQGPVISYFAEGQRVEMPEPLRKALGAQLVRRSGVSAVYRPPGGKALSL